MLDAKQAFRREALRALYWPFTLAFVLGFTDMFPLLLRGGDGAILPSLPAALLVGALGLMGCVTVALSGALDHVEPEAAPAATAPASGLSTLERRIWRWVAEGGFWAALPLGIVVGASFGLTEAWTVIPMFVIGLAMIALGMAGLWARERMAGRRQPQQAPGTPARRRAW